MGSQMSQEAKAARREYYRKWRAANPDKVAEKNRRYWEKKASQAEGNNNEQKED